MNFRAWTAFAILCVIWGIPYFFIKLALVEVSPVGVAWSRITLGALILLPIAWKRGALKSMWAHKGAILAFACIELTGPFVLISLGESWISSSLTGILIACVPLTVVLLSPLFGLKEQLGARRLGGLALGFVGVVALLGIDDLGGVHAWAGVACMLAATVGYSIGPLIVQRYLADVDELGAVATSLAVASLLLLIPAIVTAPTSIPSPVTLMSLAILGAICTALALYLFFFLIGQAGAARASVITYVNPAVAVLLGVFVLNEHFGVGSAIGFALVLVGSWFATGRGRATGPKVEESNGSALSPHQQSSST